MTNNPTRQRIMDEVRRCQAAFAALPEAEQRAAQNELRSIFQNPGVEFVEKPATNNSVELQRDTGANPALAKAEPVARLGHSATIGAMG